MYPPPADPDLPIIPGQRLGELTELKRTLWSMCDQHKAKRMRSKSASKPAARSRRKDTLPEDDHRILCEAAAHPFAPMAWLVKNAKLKMSFERQNRAVKRLAERKYIESDVLRLSSANVRLLKMTQAGFEHLGIDPVHYAGRGGLIHQTSCNWLAEVGRGRGAKVELEWSVPGTNHPADVVWFLRDQTIVFEVPVTIRSNLPDHLRACFIDSDAVDHLHIVVALKREQDQIAAQLKADPAHSPYLERVTVETLTPYKQELWP